MAKKKNIDITFKDAPEELPDYPFCGLDLDEWQIAFKNAIWSKEKLIIFSNSVAGTGKTTIATAVANLLCQAGRYEGIVYIAAPTQEQTQGYLPGSIEEKSKPYFEPFFEALDEIGVNRNVAVADEVNEKFGDAYITCRTHTHLRGVNFQNRVVIIDEAQNFYTDELMKVLTRMHDSCKVIVIGHCGQNDLYHHPERSGFFRYLEWFKDDERTAVCPLKVNHRGWISSHADQLPIQWKTGNLDFEETSQ